MGKTIISHFKDKPKTSTGWWAFGLSLATIMSGPILGISAAVVIPFLGRVAGEQLSAMVGFTVVVIVFLVYFLALGLSIKAFRQGERSWAVWTALVLSLLETCFWILMIVGEFLFPH